MVANMHWLSDVVWSAALVLSTAAILSRIRVDWLPDSGKRTPDSRFATPD
jgi:hypothetical protein